MPRPPRDLANQRFGLLTAVRINGQLQRRTAWLCRCDCGNEVTTRATSLIRGYVTSCGCRRNIIAINNIKDAALKHGLFRQGKPSKEYVAWSQMIQRCYNPNNLSYPVYGAVGIQVSDRFHYGENGKTGVECFIEDVGLAPSPLHSIDRYPNQSGNYETGNIRWATKSEQARNTKRNRYITYDGKTMIVQEWSEVTGISSAVIRKRLKDGWSIKEALSIPVMRLVGGRRRK